MTRKLVLMLVVALAAGLAAARPAGDTKKKAPEKKPAAAKKAGDTAAGQDLYKSNCAVCHFADKTDKRIGPGMKGLFKREKLFDDRPVNEENVRNLILNGGGKMIPFKEKLDSKQVDDLIAYLKTL